MPRIIHTPKNWITVTESRYAWERDGLDLVRHRFPEPEPYRAWSNFEFIADDGSINKVDLLVCTPKGFFSLKLRAIRDGCTAMPAPGRGSGTAG